MVKSPFLVIEDALSPAKCEQLIRELGIKVPDMVDDKPLRHTRIMDSEHQGGIIQAIIQDLVPKLEEQYGCNVKGMDNPLFMQYFENPSDPCEPHGCENARFLRKKWVKVKDVDLVAVLWLKDFNSGVPLDPRFETYGGKLEFPAYDFSLLPQRGTMVIYPAGPHFITAVSPVLVGTFEQIRVGIRLTNTEGGPYLYQPSNFPGTYAQWFTPEA